MEVRLAYHRVHSRKLTRIRDLRVGRECRATAGGGNTLCGVDRAETAYSVGPKRLVEKAPVQSPSLAVWQENGIEIQSTP